MDHTLSYLIHAMPVASTTAVASTLSLFSFPWSVQVEVSQKEVRLLRQQLALAQLAASSSGALLSTADVAAQGSPSRHLVSCRVTVHRPAFPHQRTEGSRV